MLKNSSLFMVGVCFYFVILMGGCGASQSTVPVETISENSSSVSNDLDSENTSDNQSVESEGNMLPNGQDETDCKAPLFSAPIMNPDDILYISALGNSNPRGGHTFPTVHTYINFYEWIEEENPIYPTKNVFSPGNLTINSIQSMQYTDENGKQSMDYSINFEVCSDVSGYLKHIKQLPPDIKHPLLAVNSSCEEYSTGGWDMKKCDYPFTKVMAPGDLLGIVGGTGANQNSFDFGLMDQRIQNAFIRQNYYPENFYTMVCPYDYFEQSIKNQYLAKIGYLFDGNLVFRENMNLNGMPLCGSMMQDVAGSLKGNWINATSGSTFNQEDAHLALIHWNYDSAYQVFSMGPQSNIFENSAYFATFIPTTNQTTNVNQEFSLATSHEILYCYDGINNYLDGIDDVRLLVYLEDDNTLHIATDFGTPICENIPTPTQFNASYTNKRTFVR